MIITRQELSKFSKANYYDGSLIHDRFAYTFFRKKTLPIGNLVTFRAPAEVSINLVDKEDLLSNDFIYSDDMIHFCCEIPLIDNIFGAIAYQRLFNTQIANILSSKYLKKPIEVDGDDLIVHDQFEQHGIVQPKGKSSVSIVHMVKNVALLHTGINVFAGKRAPAFAYSTRLSDEQCISFMKDVIDMFYSLNDDIFIASSKV